MEKLTAGFLVDILSNESETGKFAYSVYFLINELDCNTVGDWWEWEVCAEYLSEYLESNNIDHCFDCGFLSITTAEHDSHIKAKNEGVKIAKELLKVLKPVAKKAGVTVSVANVFYK
ncbi:MAG: hypothetical protein ACRCX2_18385 [Paraclostridium sp.]